jgi:hypothetical protein
MDRDPGLERLLDLDGFVAELGGGHWVKVDAVRVPPVRCRTPAIHQGHEATASTQLHMAAADTMPTRLE